MRIFRDVVVTVLKAMPVLIVMRLLMPETILWYQELSVGVVAGMASGHWLRGVYSGATGV